MDRKHSILRLLSAHVKCTLEDALMFIAQNVPVTGSLHESILYTEGLWHLIMYFLYICVEILEWAHMTSEPMDFLFTSLCAFFCGLSPWTSTIAYCFLLRRETEKLLILRIRSIGRKPFHTTKVFWTKNLYFRNKVSMLFEDNFCSQIKFILLVSFLVQWLLLCDNLSYSI